MKASVMIVVALAFQHASAAAVPVDGVLDPDYGPPLSTQTTQTSLGDESTNPFQASELDAAHAYVAGDTLHVLIAGSFNRFFSEPLVLPNQLQLWIDVRPGGQNPVSATQPNIGGDVKLAMMAGLRFDSDFAPDYWLAGVRESGNPSSTFYAYFAELPSGGGGAGYLLGRTGLGGPGTLSGPNAINPHGILAAIDVSNVAGVTEGCDASSGAGVSTGIEWAIPLAALGNTSGPIRICALLVSAGYPQARISNQVLSPVPPGTCALGEAGGVDFDAVPGLQYFTLDTSVPISKTTWSRIKWRYR